MSRPLLVTDCDEVLMHMVVPFRGWLDEAKHIHFDLSNGGFSDALRHKHDGTVVTPADVWPLLNEFFDNEMHRQMPIDGAVETLNALADIADIVVLTNLLDHRAEARAHQLKAVGIDFPVHTNQGGKGTFLAALIERYQPSVTVFVDDLHNHHDSVARRAPAAWRIHMVGEPELAPYIPAAEHAHVRIDNWIDARPWIEARFEAGLHAPDSIFHDKGTQP